jgi:phage terminase large subunit
MWFVQKVGFDLHVIDSYQNRQNAWSHYLGILQQKAYFYDRIWLPHDAKAKSLQTGKSIEEMTDKAFPRKVQIVPKLSLEDGINALRTTFSRMYFDATKCADGLQALRHYRYEVDPDTGQFSKKPLHDEHSHYSDGLRYCAVGLTETKTREKKETVRVGYRGIASGAGWMGT